MKSNKGIIIFQAIIIVLLLSLNFLLYNKSRDLEALCMSDKPEQIQPGDILPAFIYSSDDGEQNKFTFSSPQKTNLLFFFDISCGYCTSNIPKWKLLYEKLQNKYTISAVSINTPLQVKEYAEQHGITYPVISISDTLYRKHNKINAVPQTLITDENGKVKKVWVGLLRDEIIQEIINF